MDTALPTGRRGRLLALAITLVLILLVWEALVAPVLSLYDDRAASLQHDRVLLERMERVAAGLPGLQKQVSQMREAGDEEVFTIPGASDAVAAATLQNTLQEIATQAGANITSFETVPGQTVGGYRRIGLKLTMHEPWPTIVGLLRVIDTSHPPMLIDELEIHALPILAAKSQRLEASFTVYGFRAGPGGGAP